MRQGKIIAVFLCLVMLLAGATAAYAGDEQQNVIQVSGEGIVNATPDQAELSLAVVTENKDAGQAQAENARKSNQVINALKEKGIPETDIQTQNYNLSPKHSQPPRPEPVDSRMKEYVPEIVGYTATHLIRVKVKNLDTVGELMDLAVENGANQISNVSFSVSDSLAYKKEALKNAVADARAKAEVLAAALGKTLTGVQSASGSWNEANPGPIYYKEMAIGAGGIATPLTPGMAQVRAHTNITFFIK